MISTYKMFEVGDVDPASTSILKKPGTESFTSKSKYAKEIVAPNMPSETIGIKKTENQIVGGATPSTRAKVC